MDRVLLKGALAELFDEGAARFDASMAELTTFRIGGPADVLVEPRTADEARVVLAACRRLGVAVRVMGLGSDVLVADEGLRCVVVRIAESLSQVEHKPHAIASVFLNLSDSCSRRLATYV